MTVTETPALAGAVETVEPTGKVASHLHPAGSFDLAHFPVPTGREEIWRFTPLKRLRGLHDGSFARDGSATVIVDAPAGVAVDLVGRDDPRLGSVLTPHDRVSAQAWTSFTHARVVTVPADTEVDAPVTVTVTGGGAEGADFGHLYLEVGAHAKATVIVRHVGSAVRAANAEVVLGDGASLNLVTVQDWDDDAVHAVQFHARVGRDASYQQCVVSLGGDLVRVGSSVDYAGPGGSAELLGLYFTDAGQHLEHRLFVDHNAPHTSSHVDYKGALQGQGAHAVWIGDVLIRKVAEGIDTYESNRNLVLTDGCQADSVPNLEIETGEIQGAGHASTTGRFDDEQLFYLQSRGIGEDEARRLVLYGFFIDIIRKIGVPSLEADLVAKVEEELARSMVTAP